MIMVAQLAATHRNRREKAVVSTPCHRICMLTLSIATCVTGASKRAPLTPIVCICICLFVPAPCLDGWSRFGTQLG